MSESCGLADENGYMILPPTLNLNSSSLTFTDGIFLLDNGIYLILWISRFGGPFIEQLFGSAEVEKINWETAAITADPNQNPTSFRNRVASVIDGIRATCQHYQPLLIVNDTTQGAERFSQCFVEDRQKDLPSYFEFIQSINEAVTKFNAN